MTRLIKATNKDKELYKNLFNILHNDISPYNNELQEVNQKGFFDEEAVDVYFNDDPNVFPYIIYENDLIAGLVVVSGPPYVKKGCDYCIQELFILRLYRGKGVAQRAVESIFNNKGRYCVIVLKENLRAVRFWDKVICNNGVLLDKINLDDKSFAYEFLI